MFIEKFYISLGYEGNFSIENKLNISNVNSM